jgi:hypothetical protein
MIGLFDGRPAEFTGGIGWRLLLFACYLPGMLWGPLVLWVTYLYHRRRSPAGRRAQRARRLAG